VTRFKPDWLLGAAFIAAPFCWYVLSLFLEPVMAFDSVLTQRFALFAIVYPVLEEYIFRGKLQCVLRQQSWGQKSILGLSSANIITSALFAVFHIVLRPGLWSAGVFLPSLIFGFFRDRYGNIYAPIALHAFYNAGLFVLFIG
jgi:membrane protease YdiL (CAAX protease family)